MRRLLRSFFVVTVLAAIVTPVALALSFTDASYNIPTGVVGQPFSHQFGGNGGCESLPYQFRVINGSLPNGLVLEKNGLLHGVPTGAGETKVWIELSDEDPPSASWCVPKKAEREFTIKVIAGLVVNSTPPAGTVGVPYNFTLTASGGGTQAWSISGGALPAGLSLASNGGISGTPSAAGDYSFTVKVTDGTRTTSANLKISIYAPLAVIPPKLPSAEVGAPFKAPAPTVTGGLAPYKYSVNGALPAGLVIDAATGLISGTPTTAGTFAYKLVVTDGLNQVKETDQSLTVAKKLSLTAPSKVKPTEVGLDYSLTIGVTGGVQPLRWTRTGLPPGLKFDGKTGELAGKPKLGGTYHVELSATDALGATSEAVEFDIKVARKLTITTTRLLGTTAGKKFSRQIVYRGGAGKLSWKVTGGKLPVGVRLNRATGALVGSANDAGTFTFTVTVTDGLHATSTQTIVFKVVG